MAEAIRKSPACFWILRMASAIWSMSLRGPSRVGCVNQAASSESLSLAGQAVRSSHLASVSAGTISGHKVVGPTGIGILYGKTALLNSMPPYQGGGDMIKTVTFEKTTYAD